MLVRVHASTANRVSRHQNWTVFDTGSLESVLLLFCFQQMEGDLHPPPEQQNVGILN